VPRTGLSQIIHIPLRGGKIRVSLSLSVRLFSSFTPKPALTLALCALWWEKFWWNH